MHPRLKIVFLLSLLFFPPILRIDLWFLIDCCTDTPCFTARDSQGLLETGVDMCLAFFLFFFFFSFFFSLSVVMLVWASCPSFRSSICLHLWSFAYYSSMGGLLIY